MGGFSVPDIRIERMSGEAYTKGTPLSLTKTKDYQEGKLCRFLQVQELRSLLP